MSFIWPWMLFSLLLVPLLIGLYRGLLKRKTRQMAQLGSMGMVENQSGQQPQWQRHLPPFLFLISLLLLLIGLARPEMPISLPRIEGTVILAFDVSNSMGAEDLEPTRIEAAKVAARAFVENQPSTIKIGVVAFSNGGLVVQPPTNDQTAVLATIERLSPQGGTSLGHGIFTALNAIAGEPLDLNTDLSEQDTQQLQLEDFSSGVVLLLTDGENRADPDPIEVAQIAAESGVRIYPVGIGSAEGALLTLEGFNVVTQLNEPALQEIASLTNGKYFHAQDAAALEEIYKNIDLQLTIKGEKMEITAVVAGISIVFLIIGSALSLLWFGRVV